MSKQEIDFLKRTLQNAQKQGLTREIVLLSYIHFIVLDWLL